MKTNLVAALMMVMSAQIAWAQVPDFSMLNVQSHTAQPAVAAAPLTPPPAGASGQAAPYRHQVSWYNPGHTSGYNDLSYRYQNVQTALKHYAGYYGWFSRERQYYNDQARHGEDLYVRYLNYRDAYSYQALAHWVAQWEYQMGGSQGGWNQGGWNQGGWNQGGWNQGDWNQGGWNSGYSCTCYTDRWGRTISTNCQMHYSSYQNGGWNNGGNYCGCYRDAWGRVISTNCQSHGYYFPQGSFAYPVYANEQYINGLQIGNGLGNIVQGRRYDNNLQTVGGVLSTVGGVLNVVNGARGW